MVQTFGKEPDAGKRIRRTQGAKIRTARESRGLEIWQLAEAVDVSVGSISHWETGRYTPKLRHQVAIAKALDMPWSFLFGLDGEAA